jgi:hypothetical protein
LVHVGRLVVPGVERVVGVPREDADGEVRRREVVAGNWSRADARAACALVRETCP